MDITQLCQENRIFTTRSGSHSYGLNIAGSDEDFRGVFVGAPQNLVGLFPVEQCELGGDYVVFELRKFVTLARDCNPNIIELLWVDDSDILLETPFWTRIKAHRDWFLSRRAKFTFSGYATAQLKKIRGHNRWLREPQPVEAPLPAKYLRRKHIHGLGEREVFDEAAYDAAHKNWKHYWEWKANRNPARAALEEAHGFDSKHAMHMIRLLRMATEILRGDGVRVRRDDREELLAIRRGEIAFEELVAQADELQRQLDDLYPQSSLPHAPDTAKINQLMVEIYRDFWHQNAAW